MLVFRGVIQWQKGESFGSLIAMCFKVPNVKQKVDGQFFHVFPVEASIYFWLVVLWNF